MATVALAATHCCHQGHRGPAPRALGDCRLKGLPTTLTEFPGASACAESLLRTGEPVCCPSSRQRPALGHAQDLRGRLQPRVRSRTFWSPHRVPSSTCSYSELPSRLRAWQELGEMVQELRPGGTCPPSQNRMPHVALWTEGPSVVPALLGLLLCACRCARGARELPGPEAQNPRMGYGVHWWGTHTPRHSGPPPLPRGQHGQAWGSWRQGGPCSSVQGPFLGDPTDGDVPGATGGGLGWMLTLQNQGGRRSCSLVRGCRSNTSPPQPGCLWGQQVSPPAGDLQPPSVPQQAHLLPASPGPHKSWHCRVRVGQTPPKQ